MPDFKSNHWALLDLQPTHLIDGFKFTAITDVPCHLFLRMTLIAPRKHGLPSARRGTYLIGDTRYCFVVYEDNEQDEPGDTLTHTWHKTSWPVCQTRWFYFVGTQGGAPSVSETAIFKFHFQLPPPDMYLAFDEFWTSFINITVLLVSEPWDAFGINPPPLSIVFSEPWSYLSTPPPAFTQKFVEPWTYSATPPPALSLLFTESWDTYYPPSMSRLLIERWTS